MPLNPAVKVAIQEARMGDATAEMVQVIEEALEKPRRRDEPRGRVVMLQDWHLAEERTGFLPGFVVR